MAFDTDKCLRNQVMYSVFVRNYSQEGTESRCFLVAKGG